MGHKPTPFINNKSPYTTLKSDYIEHHVSTVEMGECFYAWLDMLSNKNVKIKFFQQEVSEPFPFPIPSGNIHFKKEFGRGSKSGTLQSINERLANHTNLSDILIGTIQESLGYINTLPTFIEQKLNPFIEKTDKIALIHIRHKFPDDKRNLDEEEFGKIVNSLRSYAFNKFILIGDLSQCFYLKKYLKENVFCLLDYVMPRSETSECQTALLKWGEQEEPQNSKSFLAKQILLIHIIRTQFPEVRLLIGRKSGAGLDMHAYAGIPTIFLEDDSFNNRYAPLETKNKWRNAYLPHLIPVFCPSNEGIILDSSTPSSGNFFNHRKNAKVKKSEQSNKNSIHPAQTIKMMNKEENSTSLPDELEISIGNSIKLLEEIPHDLPIASSCILRQTA